MGVVDISVCVTDSYPEFLKLKSGQGKLKLLVGKTDAILSGLLGLDTGWESHDYNTEGNSTTKTNNNSNNNKST